MFPAKKMNEGVVSASIKNNAQDDRSNYVSEIFNVFARYPETVSS